MRGYFLDTTDIKLPRNKLTRQQQIAQEVEKNYAGWQRAHYLDIYAMVLAQQVVEDVLKEASITEIVQDARRARSMWAALIPAMG